MPDKTVAIITTVHNGEQFLRQTIDSVLAQTYPKWDHYILDDASTDDSRGIANEYAARDARVRLIASEQNIGTFALANQGLEIVGGKYDYIARLDADDVMLPNRLERQVTFLQKNPDVGLVGSAVQTISATGQLTGTRSLPMDDISIRWQEMSGRAATFVHSAVMFRDNIIADHGLRYNTVHGVGQDKEMWRQLLAHTRGANIAEPLVQYRLHGNSITATKLEQQRANGLRVCMAWMTSLLGHEPDRAVAERLIDWHRPMERPDIAAWDLAIQLLDAFEAGQQRRLNKLRLRLLGRLVRFARPNIWQQLGRDRIWQRLVPQFRRKGTPKG